jgi:hypothetical protein
MGNFFSCCTPKKIKTSDTLVKYHYYGSYYDATKNVCSSCFISLREPNSVMCIYCQNNLKCKICDRPYGVTQKLVLCFSCSHEKNICRICTSSKIDNIDLGICNSCKL